MSRLTTNQVAKYLNIGVSTVYLYIKKGLIPEADFKRKGPRGSAWLEESLSECQNKINLHVKNNPPHRPSGTKNTRKPFSIAGDISFQWSIPNQQQAIGGDKSTV